ncbi:MAG: DUF2165 family protein [Opitutales bacterium]
MISRISKIALLLAVAFFYFLVVLNNLTDYGSNYDFVEGVLSMETTFEGNKLMWRAINSEVVYHIFYATIIIWEVATMVLCVWAAWKLFVKLGAPASEFDRAKDLAYGALTLGLLQWFVAFITVGGEWFVMWQSPIWNGQDAAFRMFTILGICLVFIYLREDELGATSSARPAAHASTE